MLSEPEAYPPELAVGVTSSRLVGASEPARSVHRAILLGFAARGRPPDLSTLAGSAPGGRRLEALLAELHEHDVIRLDDQGRIRVAYPFSAEATRHVVAIDGGPTVHAMCAIDALGMADMLGRAVTISSTDPTSGEPIDVAVQGTRADWRPDTAVVFVGADTPAPGGDCCPPEAAGQSSPAPAADRCCGVMNFFTGPDTAAAWRAAHPLASGTVLAKEQALRLGIDIFGHLLDD